VRGETLQGIVDTGTSYGGSVATTTMKTCRPKPGQRTSREDRGEGINTKFIRRELERVQPGGRKKEITAIKKRKKAMNEKGPNTLFRIAENYKNQT